MDGDKFNLCDSLIKWVQVLNLKGQYANASELSDGVVMAKLMHQIAPDYFTDVWLSKIKLDVGENWRLKVSNLKKVVEGVFDFYPEVLNLNLSDCVRPDVMKIAEEADEEELGRLLQLILGCAVNCAQKQDYITQIMMLEESQQRNIMKAIQDLEEAWQGTLSSRNSMTLSGSQDVKTVQDDRDRMAQKCHDMEMKIAFLLEEKSSLLQEMAKLQQVVQKFENPTVIGDDGTSIGPVQLGSSRYNDLRKQMDSLKDELLQAETARDDLKMKSNQQEKEIASLQLKIDELNHASSELAQLKDEMDALKESNDKLKIYETQLQTYKKKLEDHNDLKKQVKMLEDRSAEYLQQNIEYEEEAKKHTKLKKQLELYKHEIDDLNSKLDTELSKTVNAEFEVNNMKAKMLALQREKDNLLAERDLLRDTCDELRCQPLAGEEAGTTMSRELLSPGLKQRLDMLEVENKALRDGQNGQNALAQLLDDSNQRIKNLREQLKESKQKILSLSQSEEDVGAKGDFVSQLKQTVIQNEQKHTELEEANTQVEQLQTRNNQLEATLAMKKQEIVAVETKYRKYIEKAKGVLTVFDPRGSSSEPNVMDKPQEQVEQDTRTPMGPVEERLITTAFYRLSLACQREAVDNRLALLSGTGTQSFLARQRQPTSRKPMNMNYKGK